MSESATETIAKSVDHLCLNDYLGWFEKINVNTLIWQLIAVTIFLYFGKEIKHLVAAVIDKIPQIKKFGSVDFLSDETVSALNENKEKMKEEIGSYAQVVKQDPNIVFLTHFIDFERTLRILYSLNHRDEGKRAPILEMLRQLAKEGVVDARSVSIYRDIQGIRNKLVHGDYAFSSPDEASQYLEAVLLLKDSIKSKERLHNWEACAS